MVNRLRILHPQPNRSGLPRNEVLFLFKTQFDKHERIFQNPGSPVKVTYAPQYDKNGVLDLVILKSLNLISV